MTVPRWDTIGADGVALCATRRVYDGIAAAKAMTLRLRAS